MNWDEPHCPSWTGGVAATSTKVAKHRQGADGVVVQMFCSSLNNAPRLCRQWLLRNILFLAQPPLLAMSGRGGCSNVFLSLNNAPRLCRRWLLCNILFLAQPPPLLDRSG